MTSRAFAVPPIPLVRAPAALDARERAEWCRYAAGLFEGEGCVSIAKSRQRSGRWQWLLTVTVKMADPEPVMLLRDLWGGAVHQPTVAAGRKELFAWRASARQASGFLREIEAYCVSARRRAAIALAIEFQNQKRNTGCRPPIIYLEAQEAFDLEMRHLNGSSCL